ncbi:hypothetical protein PFISCL1PPCAC_12637, partial [Pristionchus fissidentatus]
SHEHHTIPDLRFAEMAASLGNHTMIANFTEITTTMVSAVRSPAQLGSVFEHLKIIYALLLPPMIIILLIAVIGNGVIVVSAHKLTSPVSPYLRLCVSLAAADAWAAFLMMTGLIVNSLMPVMLGVKKQTMCFDAVLEIFRISGMLTSDMHLFALAINQFIGTMWPLKYKMIVTSRRLRSLVFLLWIVPIIFTGSWFFVFPNDGFRHPKCNFVFYNRFAPFRITIFTVFVLPLLATLIIYAIILNHLLKAKAQFNKTTEQTGSTACAPRKNHVNSRLKLVWTTLLIVSTFTFSWGICVCYFLLVCKQDCMFIYMHHVGLYAGIFFGSTVNCLVILKLAANPFIYTLRIRAIRRSVESFIGKRFFANRRTGCYGKNNSSIYKNNSATPGKLPVHAPLLSSHSYTVVNDEHSSRVHSRVDY